MTADNEHAGMVLDVYHDNKDEDIEVVTNLEDYLDPVYLFQVSIHCLVSPLPWQPIIEKINDS